MSSPNQLKSFFRATISAGFQEQQQLPIHASPLPKNTLPDTPYFSGAIEKNKYSDLIPINNPELPR
jgi:hypothetical protein